MPLDISTIHPTQKHNRPPAPSKIPLHGLDLLSAPIQIHNHRFYHCPKDHSKVIDKLKTSLAEALELYPTVAGVVTSDDKGDTYIATDNKTVGTPFMVERKDIPFDGKDSEDLSPRTEQILAPGSSSLAVKITQFSCGTIVVASSLHHQVADLRGFLDFLQVWAKIARDEDIHESSLPEDWTRTPGQFFKGLKTSDDPQAPPPFELVDTPVTGPPAYLLVPSQVTRWELTRESMTQLKKDFAPSDSKEWISTGDALAALLSGAVARAREQAKIPRLEGRSTEASGVEKIAMAADGRDRCPEQTMAGGKYFGNFNNLWSVSIPRTDLVTPTREASGRVALAIRQGLQAALAPKAVADRIAFFENPSNTHPPGRIYWSADIILTNWCRFDLKGSEYDLGWGKPFMTTDGSASVFPPGYSLMTQDYDSGSVIVLLTVEHDAVQVLKSDPLLTQYATALL